MWPDLKKSIICLQSIQENGLLSRNMLEKMVYKCINVVETMLHLNLTLTLWQLLLEE